MIGLMMAAAVAAPYATSETRVALPFAVMAAHRAIGSVCGWRSGVLGPDIAGFTATRTPPIALPGGAVVVVRERDGHRFAFLTRLTAEEPVATCRVADVAPLPPMREAPALLQCAAARAWNAQPGAPGSLNGIGVRAAGHRDPVGFWSVSPDGRRLQRVDLRGPGLSGRLRCREPETGE